MAEAFSPNIALRTEIGSPFPVHATQFVRDKPDSGELFAVGECVNEDRMECVDLLRAFGIDVPVWILPEEVPDEDDERNEPHDDFWGVCGGTQGRFRGLVGPGGPVLWFPGDQLVLWKTHCCDGPTGFTSFVEVTGRLRGFDPNSASWSEADLACRLTILGPEIRPEDTIPLSDLTPEQVTRVINYLTDPQRTPGSSNGRKTAVTMFLARVPANKAARWIVFDRIAHELSDLLPLFQSMGSHGKIGPKVHRQHLESRVAELCTISQSCTGHDETWAELERTAQLLATACGLRKKVQ